MFFVILQKEHVEELESWKSLVSIQLDIMTMDNAFLRLDFYIQNESKFDFCMSNDLSLNSIIDNSIIYV